jgi:hypothetical protein
VFEKKVLRRVQQFLHFCGRYLFSYFYFVKDAFSVTKAGSCKDNDEPVGSGAMTLIS